MSVTAAAIAKILKESCSLFREKKPLEEAIRYQVSYLTLRLQKIRQAPVLQMHIKQDIRTSQWDKAWILCGVDGESSYQNNQDTYGSFIFYVHLGEIMAAAFCLPDRDENIWADQKGCFINGLKPSTGTSLGGGIKMLMGPSAPPLKLTQRLTSYKPALKHRPAPSKTFGLKRLLEGSADSWLIPDSDSWEVIPFLYTWRIAGGFGANLDYDASDKDPGAFLMTNNEKTWNEIQTGPLGGWLGP